MEKFRCNLTRWETSKIRFQSLNMDFWLEFFHMFGGFSVLQVLLNFTHSETGNFVMYFFLFQVVFCSRSLSIGNIACSFCLSLYFWMSRCSLVSLVAKKVMSLAGKHLYSTRQLTSKFSLLVFLLLHSFSIVFFSRLLNDLLKIMILKNDVGMTWIYQSINSNV